MSLKVKFNGAVGLPIYDFLLVSNSNYMPNSHRLGVTCITTRKKIPYLLSLGPNFDFLHNPAISSPKSKRLSTCKLLWSSHTTDSTVIRSLILISSLVAGLTENHQFKLRWVCFRFKPTDPSFAFDGALDCCGFGAHWTNGPRYSVAACGRFCPYFVLSDEMVGGVTPYGPMLTRN